MRRLARALQKLAPPWLRAAGALAVLALGPDAEGDAQLLSPQLRRRLEAAGSELAEGGRETEVAGVLSALEALGLDERARARLDKRWTRDLADPAPAWRSAAARRELRRAVEQLEARLAQAPAHQELLLARVLRTLDDQHPEANRALGYTLFRGAWMSPEEAHVARGRERLAEDRRWASGLSFPIEFSVSALPPVEALGLGVLRKGSALGVSLHARLPEERMRRILTEALRAAALSYATTNGTRKLPRFARADYLVVPHGMFAEALTEAAANGGVAADEEEVLRNHSSFDDARGWYTCRWRNEAELEALVLFDQSRGWLGWSAQPTLLAGHVNWVALRQLGTLLPLLSWRDRRFLEDMDRSAAVRGGARRASSFLRTSSRGLYGTRRFLTLLAERGEDPPWARSMVDHVGKIQDVDLLKTTLVVEYLMELGSFGSLLRETAGKPERVAAFEAALDQELPHFEAEWRGWLLGSERGILQRLQAEAPLTDPLQAALLAALNRVRDRAFRETYPPALRDVWLDHELSRGARLHADYLARHPEQKDQWPGAHEEYADRAAFTPEGAWAGSHSVIHLGDPRRAVETWMATFYHRLPLLDPGLLGVGLGATSGVVVGDVLSLVAPLHEETWIVWPPDGAEDVPRAFHPELPLPVPGRPTHELGYPVTLQVFGRDVDPEARFTMELRKEGTRGAVVESVLSSPTDPGNRKLAPPGAFCLIPLEHLEPSTRYSVTASRLEPQARTLRWSFVTGAD